MITYYQAKEIAVKKDFLINACAELPDAWEFANLQTASANHMPFVVMKKSGQIMELTEYYLQAPEGAEAVMVDFATGEKL